MLGLLACAPVRAAEPRVIHVEPAGGEAVFVIDQGDRRYLRFGSAEGDDQSVISLTDPLSVPLPYVRDALLALAFLPRPGRTLMIGLGGGAFTTRLRQSYPDAEIDIVDVNPAVVKVAKRFFGVREDSRLRIHVDDGRRFVERSKDKYDLILIDAYTGDGIPAHLTGADFFALVAARLALGGVAALNIAADDTAEREIVRAFAGVFGARACLRTVTDGNLLVFGQRSPLPAASALRERAAVIAREG
ncbi:MAG: fused MFS/spermidine synthase, partial [Deltaproteobacteria bacterium]|nr:fused MFS/spermidine synthase [Deltaproteobacteria bacterium]